MMKDTFKTLPVIVLAAAARCSLQISLADIETHSRKH